MIPSFPQFKNVDVSDYSEVQSFLNKYPCYSDFNFTSLWAWDINAQRQVSFLNNNLVVRFTDYLTQEPFFSFLGDTNTSETTQTLLKYSQSVGIGSLRLVPEISVHEIQEKSLQVDMDRDNFDYVYLTSRLSVMGGRQYKQKRQEADRFARKYPSAKVEVVKLNGSAVQKSIASIAKEWAGEAPSAQGSALELHEEELEQEAISRLFEIQKLNPDLLGMVLSVDGAPVAFTLEEVLAHKFAMGHFWKSNPSYDGSYSFLAQHMARHLLANDIQYWNMEQDLGIEGLRFSKSSYRPSDFLKKFTVS